MNDSTMQEIICMHMASYNLYIQKYFIRQFFTVTINHYHILAIIIAYHCYINIFIAICINFSSIYTQLASYIATLLYVSVIYKQLILWVIIILFVTAILTLVAAQCTNDRAVQFFEDGEILSQSATVNRNVGDSFTIGCQRCNERGPPSWFYSNGSTVISCNGFNESVCVEMNENTSTSDLHFTSFTTSQAGIYRCTNSREISIIANEPGQLIID